MNLNPIEFLNFPKRCTTREVLDRAILFLNNHPKPEAKDLLHELVIMRSMYGDDETFEWMAINGAVQRWIHFEL